MFCWWVRKHLFVNFLIFRQLQQSYSAVRFDFGVTLNFLFFLLFSLASNLLCVLNMFFYSHLTVTTVAVCPNFAGSKAVITSKEVVLLSLLVTLNKYGFTEGIWSWLISMLNSFWYYSVGIYMFQVINENTMTMYEICSKLTMTTAELLHWHCFAIFVVSFEQVSHFFLAFTIFDLEQVNIPAEN